MQGKNKVLLRNLKKEIEKLIRGSQSALIFGPRQVGKTTLIKEALLNAPNVREYPLQNPEIHAEIEKDPAILSRQLLANKNKPYVFVDEAQKVPEIFDGIQYILDEKKAKFLITGSSARKLRRKGSNLLPGRVKIFHLDPLLWNEFGWIKENNIKELEIKNINKKVDYFFEKSLIFGALPGIVNLNNDNDRKDFLKAYAHIYLEEEIRAEALSRKIGAFSRFLELSANESGTSPNFTKLSMESGVSMPAIREFYNLLEDTLIVERIDPYLKNARKRILASSRYYFFDLGVRNSLARFSLNKELINSQKGILFEHAIILEIIRRIRSLNKEFKVCYWRTSGGAEVDCVIDLGHKVIPVEIKASKKIALSELKGLKIFLDDYKDVADIGYVITWGDKPEQLADNIIALPWSFI